jgi:hypothetical protein
MRRFKFLALALVLIFAVVAIADYSTMYFVNTSHYYDDTSLVYFGTDKDFSLKSATAKTLSILPLGATDDYAVNIGLDQSGVDLKVFGATTGNYLEWDASANTLTMVGKTIQCTTTTPATNTSAYYFGGSLPTGNSTWGWVYGDVTIVGTNSGQVAAMNGVVWCDSGSTPSSVLYGGLFGVSESGADMTGCGSVVGLGVSTQVDSTNPPQSHYMMRFNTVQGGDVPDGWFIAANPESIAYTASTATNGTKVGAIKIHIQGAATPVVYIRVYDSAI